MQIGSVYVYYFISLKSFIRTKLVDIYQNLIGFFFYIFQRRSFFKIKKYKLEEKNKLLFIFS
jgi:hypothetical protein